MKALLYLCALCVCWAARSEEERYLFFLDNTHLGLAESSQLEATIDDLAIVKIPVSEAEKWGHWVHERLKGCGGFIDVTEKIAEGFTPGEILWQEMLRRTREVSTREFVVGNQPLVHSLVAQVDETQLWLFLKELSSFPDRSATTDNGAAASKFLKDRAMQYAEDLPGLFTWTVKTGSGSYSKQPSVVATLPGEDTSLPSVVIGAHMDTFSNNKPGADDDGSGTSIVMEALRTIAMSGAKFERTIHFVWYAAEERGLVGSSYVVQDFETKEIPVHAAIQFDMVGFNSPSDVEDVFVITDYTHKDLNQALKIILQNYLPSTHVAETKCGYACSDHVNWHMKGIPVVFPFESRFSNMNQRLHTTNDKIEFLDPKHAAHFGRLALAFLGEMASLKSLYMK